MSQQKLSEPLIAVDPLVFKRANKTLREAVYDPLQIPPDIDLAKRHGLATRVCKFRTKPITADTAKCPCCNLPIENQQLDLTCKIKEFTHIGVAICIYFEYIKMTFILVTAHIVLAGLTQLVLNSMGNMCLKLHNNTFICEGSVINILNLKDTTYVRIQNILNCFFVVVSFFIIEGFKLKQKLFQFKYSKKTWLVEDYTVIINHFPHGTTLEEVKAKVMKLLNFSDLTTEEKIIAKIYFIFDIQSYVKLLDEEAMAMSDLGTLRFEYEEMKKKLIKESKQDKHLMMTNIEAKQEEIGTVEVRITQLKQQIKVFEVNFYEEYQKVCVGKLNVKEETLTFSGRCIVTLNSRKARDLLLKSDQLNIAKCYNPTDIIYKNFGMPKVRVPKSKHIMYLLIALVGDFFFLTLLKKFIKVEQATAISQVRLFVLSAVSSIICCGFNTLFGIMIRHFARTNPNYETRSDFFASVAQQLNVTFMINMLATTYFSNTVSFWIISYGQSTYPHFPLNFLGLVYDVFFLFITNSYASSIMSYFDIVWYWRLWKRWKINKELNVTQTEANLHYENHPMDLALRYVNVNKVILISAAMAPLIPIGLEFTLVALVILFWIDKYLFIRRFTSRFKLSTQFSDSIFKQLQLYPLFLSFFNVLVMFVPVEEYTNSQTKISDFIYPNNQNSVAFYLAIFIFILSMVYNFTHKNYILSFYKRVFRSSIPEEIETDESNYGELYLDILHKFPEDYSEFYPYFEVSRKESYLAKDGRFFQNLLRSVESVRFQIKE